MSEEEPGVDPYLEEIAGLSKDELDRRLGKFGVKPLPKAQAIAFLQYVHKVNGKKSPGKQSASRAQKKTSKRTPKKSPKVKKPRAATKAKESLPEDQPENAPSTSTEILADPPLMQANTSAKRKRKSKRDEYKVKLFDSSSEDEKEDEGTIVNRQDVVDIPVEEIEDGSVSPPKLKAVLRRLKTAEEVDAFMMQYIRDRPDLHEKILQYETVYLKPLLKQLKEEEGVVPKTDLLMDFFDAKTVCFSQHNAEKPRQWGGSKDKKKPKS